jgi:hypothetical protein
MIKNRAIFVQGDSRGKHFVSSTMNLTSMGTDQEEVHRGFGRRLLLFVPLCVYLRKVGPLFRKIFQSENSRYRAGGNAGATVDTLIRFDIKLLDLLEIRFVLLGVNAIDRADIDTCRIFGTNARFSDYINHNKILL